MVQTIRNSDFEQNWSSCNILKLWIAVTFDPDDIVYKLNFHSHNTEYLTSPTPTCNTPGPFLHLFPLTWQDLKCSGLHSFLFSSLFSFIFYSCHFYKGRNLYLLFILLTAICKIIEQFLAQDGYSVHLFWMSKCMNVTDYTSVLQTMMFY